MCSKKKTTHFPFHDFDVRFTSKLIYRSNQTGLKKFVSERVQIFYAFLNCAHPPMAGDN